MCYSNIHIYASVWVERGREKEGEREEVQWDPIVYPSVLVNKNSNHVFHLYSYLILCHVKKLNLAVAVILLSIFPTHLEKQIHGHNATN